MDLVLIPWREKGLFDYYHKFLSKYLDMAPARTGIVVKPDVRSHDILSKTHIRRDLLLMVGMGDLESEEATLDVAARFLNHENIIVSLVLLAPDRTMEARVEQALIGVEPTRVTKVVMERKQITVEALGEETTRRNFDFIICGWTEAEIEGHRAVKEEDKEILGTLGSAISQSDVCNTSMIVMHPRRSQQLALVVKEDEKAAN
jgi:hypothetical protein